MSDKIKNLLKFKHIRINKAAWGLLLPCLLGCFIFIFVPAIISFCLSFTNYNLLNEIKFVGFFNYTELFQSKMFWLVLINTIVYSLSVTVFATIIPIILASILYRKTKLNELMKTVYFIPFITPMIAIAMVWQWIFDPNIGFLHTVLKSNLQWIYSPETAMIAIIIVSVWKLIGYNTVIMLTGFASINTEVYEAAEVDGSNKLSTFFKITLPLLAPTIFFVIVITTISSFQVFDLIYLMTQGGPENSTNILVYWLYKNAFEYFYVGKASSLAYVLFVVIAVLTFIQWKIRTKWVKSEEE